MRLDALRCRINFRAFPIFSMALLAIAVALPLAPVGAQMIPPHPVLRDFEPLGEYVLVVGGAPLPGVQMFRSDKAGSAVLMTGPGLRSALVLMPRDKAVQRVDKAKVVVGPDGRAFLLADAQPVRESAFTVEGMEIVFTVEGKPARLKEKPYLLGLHAGKDLIDHDSTYAFRAKQYSPSPALVRALRQAAQPIRVRVFFGNWCPHCQQMVPRILRLADSLAGSQIHFEFYGLPSPFDKEPEAKRMGITGVPTGVVYRGAKEVGRIAGGEWSIPELAIKKVLDDSATQASR
ncbi:MAG TPA: thioredoxin domain-containing protein [Thermoanaerobaculia bacterium]|jgi:thiol-disulfide isomerase/thioredoxin|nr:thioredoxin domain-containing protein [Thermoanaerobaculia bacterium]